MNRAETLEQLARLCRREGATPPAVHASGHAALDAVLPHGGWQSGTIVELMPTQIGAGEFRLLMPALASITKSDRYIAFVSPPYIPFAPALQRHGMQLDRLLIVNAEKNVDALWATEQALRCKSFGAVIAWPESIKDRDVRRLQLASEAGRSVGFLYRSINATFEASPAAVRLKLQCDAAGALKIHVLKCRGTRSGFTISLDNTNQNSLDRSSELRA